MNIPTLYEDTWWPTFFSSCLTTVAAIFAYDAWAGRFPMSPDVYGAIVYTIPAETWSMAIFGTHGLYIVGQIKENGHGAKMCFASSILGLLIYFAFFAFSSSAEFGGIVVYFSMFLLVPFQLVIMWQSVAYLWGRRHVKIQQR